MSERDGAGPTAAGAPQGQPKGAGRARLLLKLGRWHFVFGGLLLFLLGVLLARANGASLEPGRLLLGYAALFCAHLSVSYSNDYFDRAGDRFSTPSPFAGGSGVLVAHPGLGPAARAIALGLIAASLALGALFAWLYRPHWSFFPFVAAGNALGWFYSAPPVRLSSRGLGELSTSISIGLMLPGMGFFVASGGIGTAFLVLALPLLMYGLAFIVSVEIPDVEADREAGKRTLALRFGRPAAFVLNGSVVAAASGLLAVLAWSRWDGSGEYTPLALLSLIPLVAGMAGLALRPKQREAATRLVNANLSSFILFVLLADSWLLLAPVPA